MLELGRRAGQDVVCLLTDMDQPLGAAVGNALEIGEARDTVRGEGPPDFTELVLDACARLLSLSDLGVDVDEGRRAPRPPSPTARRTRSTSVGSGRRAAIPSLDALPQAPVVRAVQAPRDGTVVRLGAIAVGIAALELGAGRRTKESEIDHAVGVVCPRSAARASRPATRSRRCTPATKTSGEEAAAAVLAAYELGDEPPREHPILLDVLS